jgi:Fe-S cluster assembly ATP-binding protein
MSHVLLIEGLRANVGSREILRGIDLEVNSGEVHVVMGPNGSGKSTLSHVIAGRPGYEVTGGKVTLDGLDLLSLPAWQRARAGLFLAMQYPIEVPGVSLVDALSAAFVSNGRPPALVPELLAAEADRVGLDRRFLLRPLNVDLSGGERKRNETVQLGVIGPLFAVLDEIDSGLDVDALRAVAQRIEAATAESGLGVLAITHYNRLLHELHADRIHVLIEGRIVASGGPELAEELETTGYTAYGVDEPAAVGAAVGAGGAVGNGGPANGGPANGGRANGGRANGGRAKPSSVARTDLDPFADPFA